MEPVLVSGSEPGQPLADLRPGCCLRNGRPGTIFRQWPSHLATSSRFSV